MARITVEDCLTKEQNRFALVLLAAKRTKQILTGSTVLIDDKRDNKAVVTSLREIAAGLVRFKTEDDLEKEREAALAEREAELQERESAGAMESENGSEDGAAEGGESSGEEGSEGGEGESLDTTTPAA